MLNTIATSFVACCAHKPRTASRAACELSRDIMHGQVSQLESCNPQCVLEPRHFGGAACYAAWPADRARVACMTTRTTCMHGQLMWSDIDVGQIDPLGSRSSSCMHHHIIYHRVRACAQAHNRAQNALRLDYNVNIACNT